MKCINCGATTAPSDTYCPRCGIKLYPPQQEHKSPIQPPGQEIVQHTKPNINTSDFTTSNHGYITSKQKKSNNSWIAITTAIIVAIALVGGALYMGVSHQDEETLWEQCEQSNEITDYKKYLDKYPEGEHSAQAKRMYTQLINEKTIWEQVQASNDEFQLRSFINNHPGSKYLPKAKDMLDDVMWSDALEKNTKMAYNDYIIEFPNGKHIGEARSRFEEFRIAELTAEERDQVKATIHRFLSGLELWDVTELTTVCNTEMSNFMGKHSATHNDVKEFFNAYRESGIDSIAFSSLAVDVKKSMDSNHRPRFRADFTVMRRYWRSGSETVTTSMMRGSALVDNYYRFNEFNLDKVSEN